MQTIYKYTTGRKWTASQARFLLIGSVARQTRKRKSKGKAGWVVWKSCKASQKRKGQGGKEKSPTLLCSVPRYESLSVRQASLRLALPLDEYLHQMGQIQ
jgi:hypothetical protein